MTPFGVVSIAFINEDFYNKKITQSPEKSASEESGFVGTIKLFERIREESADKPRELWHSVRSVNHGSPDVTSALPFPWRFPS